MSYSKPIEDYALIGDGQTVALVARDGAIDWLCWPRFDSDACLAALLGTEESGTWQIAPTNKHEVSRHYAGDDLVLVTEFACPGGATLVLTDFMPIRDGDGSAVVRRLEARGGSVEVQVTLRLMFGYGELPPWWQQEDGAWVGEIGPDRLVLHGPGLSQNGSALRGTITLADGERAISGSVRGRGGNSLTAAV